MEPTTTKSTQGAEGVTTSVYGAATVVILGIFEATYGLALLLNENILKVASGSGGVILWSTDVWGWVMTALGAITIAIGFGLASRFAWVALAITGAVLVAATQVVTLTLFPLWSALVVGLAVASIYVLSKESS